MVKQKTLALVILVIAFFVITPISIYSFFPAETTNLKRHFKV